MVRRITEVINNSGSTAQFFDQVLYDGQVWEIVDRKLELWRDDITVSGAISSGTLLVRDGGQTFADPVDGLQYFYDNPRPLRPTTIDLPGESVLTLSSGVDAVGGLSYVVGTKAVVPAGGITVTSGTDTITISGSDAGDEEGKIYQISYGANGTATNKWLEVGHGNPSNQSPHLILYPSQLIAVTFSNKRSGADTDVEIYKAAEGDGSSDSLIFTWELENVRVARKTDMPSLSFDPGDKVAVYVRDQGTNVQDPIVNLYLQIDTGLSEESVENYSGNF